MFSNRSAEMIPRIQLCGHGPSWAYPALGEYMPECALHLRRHEVSIRKAVRAALRRGTRSLRTGEPQGERSMATILAVRLRRVKTSMKHSSAHPRSRGSTPTIISDFWINYALASR